MERLLIGLDEDAIKRDGVYDVAELWHDIDTICLREGNLRRTDEDGTVLYGNDADKDITATIWTVICELRDADWFKQYCNDWLWLELDKSDDEYGALDMLSKYCNRQSSSIIDEA